MEGCESGESIASVIGLANDSQWDEAEAVIARNIEDEVYQRWAEANKDCPDETIHKLAELITQKIIQISGTQ